MKEKKENRTVPEKEEKDIPLKEEDIEEVSGGVKWGRSACPQARSQRPIKDFKK